MILQKLQMEDICIGYNYLKQMFLNLMTNLRKEIKAEKAPLIIGEISEKITDNWGLSGGVIKKMNSLLHELKNEIPLCDIVSVEGLLLKEDGLHFNSASYRELGKRYFEKYRYVKEKNS